MSDSLFWHTTTTYFGAHFMIYNTFCRHSTQDPASRPELPALALTLFTNRKEQKANPHKPMQRSPKGHFEQCSTKDLLHGLNEVLNHLWWRYYLSWNTCLNEFDSDQTNLRIPVSSALLPEWSLEWSPVPGPQSWFPVTTISKSPKQLLEAHWDGTTVRHWNQSRRKKGEVGGGREDHAKVVY